MSEEIIHWAKLTPAERDMLVHTQVMHLQPEPCTDGQLDPFMGAYWSCTCGWISSFYLGEDESTEHNKPVPCYSESMDAAWLVLQESLKYKKNYAYGSYGERFTLFARTLLVDDEYIVGDELYPGEQMIDIAAKWTPERICRASLKAIGLHVVEE